jgi:hypothetical protein
MQRNGGWSMQGLDNQEWAATTIRTIRQYTDRPIIIRSHPGDGKAKLYLNSNNKDYKLKDIGSNVSFSINERTFLEDLKDAHAVIVHNSSPAIGAAIEGVPVFLTDPESSQAKDVANTDLSKIESPVLYDREPWLQRISMFHWNFDELKSGEAWRHMKEYI